MFSCAENEFQDEATQIEEVTEEVEIVEEISTADFTIDNLNGLVMEKEALLLTNNSEYAVSYSWDFGNGETSEEANPTYAYEFHGFYEVKLTITDKEGLVREATRNIEVLCPFAGQIHPETSN